MGEDLFDFIRSQPGGSAHADWMFAAIDKKALEIGHKMLRLFPHVEELRLRQGTPFVLAQCKQIADAIERDPSGRLVAIPSLYAWASKEDGPGRHWVTWYRDHLDKWLEAYPQIQFAEAAE